VSKTPSLFLTTIEAAAVLRLEPHTLENMHWQGTDPKFRKHGGRIFYHQSELKKWSDSRRRQSSSARMPSATGASHSYDGECHPAHCQPARLPSMDRLESIRQPPAWPLHGVAA
jgi:hypothetical protein